MGWCYLMVRTMCHPITASRLDVGTAHITSNGIKIGYGCQLQERRAVQISSKN